MRARCLPACPELYNCPRPESRKRELEALEKTPSTVGGIPVDPARKIDYRQVHTLKGCSGHHRHQFPYVTHWTLIWCGTTDTQDFFGAPTFLTVSGQLQAEIGACALSNVYTFGPTFRAVH
eukprot:COSAG01_NODE_6270_length_3761_cov_20.095576_4_plen_121_part_00